MEREINKRANILTNVWAVGVLAIFCTALWGSAYPCVKIGYELFEIAPEDISAKILFAGYRFFLAGIMTCILEICLFKHLPKVKRQNLAGVLGLGLVQTTIQYVFFYIGVANTTGVKGSVISASNSFFTIILAHFFMKNEKLDKKKTLGCILGFAGVVLASFTTQGLDASFKIQGEGFLILSALAYASAALWSKSLTRREEPVTVTGLQLLFGGAVLIAAGLAAGGRIGAVSGQGMVLLVYMAFISCAAFTLWTLLLKYNPVGRVAVYGFMIPVFGVFLSALFLGENAWNLKNLAALVLVSAGIIAVNKESRGFGSRSGR